MILASVLFLSASLWDFVMNQVRLVRNPKGAHSTRFGQVCEIPPALDLTPRMQS